MVQQMAWPLSPRSPAAGSRQWRPASCGFSDAQVGLPHGAWWASGFVSWKKPMTSGRRENPRIQAAPASQRVLAKVTQSWYNKRRCHSARDNLPPARTITPSEPIDLSKYLLICDEELGGHLKSYRAAA